MPLLTRPPRPDDTASRPRPVATSASAPAPVPSLADQPDAALAALARADASQRKAAFSQLHARYADEVFAFLVVLLRDRALAEDTLQEAFYRLYRGLESYEPSRPFRPWLHQVVRNTAIDALRTRRKATTAASPAAPERAADETGPLEALAKAENLATARDAFEALPEETRALLYQRHTLGLKLEELAASWAVTERTIRNRLEAAADQLARLLVQRRRAQGGRS